MCRLRRAFRFLKRDDSINNMLESKECIELPPHEETKAEKVWNWIDDRNPIPYSWRHWYDRQDWLHPRRTYYKFVRILSWIPVLWNDVDWDYSGIWHILYFKLRLMRGEQSIGSLHVDSDKTCAEMRVAEDCAYRLWKDTYLSAEWDAHHNKWPSMFERKSEWVHLPNGSVRMPDMKEREREEFHRLADEQERLTQADMDQLSKSLATQIRRWWD